MPEHEKDFPQAETLIAFESGHYKSFIGQWQGDSVWSHFKKEDGSIVHVNKDKVEYIQTKEVSVNGKEDAHEAYEGKR